jgi:hypothetical protein
MVKFQSLSDSVDHNVVEPKGGAVILTHDYFGRYSAVQVGPEAFLADYPANYETAAHFHSVDQFQLFLGSAGAYYRHEPIGRATVHYTDAYTTYGPFGTTESPMRFFTLRPAGSTITGFMPEMKDSLPRPLKPPHRNYVVDLENWLSEPLPPAGESHCISVLDKQSDDLAMTVLIAGPNCRVVIGEDVSAAGYCCVLEGELRGEETYGPLSIGWVAPGGGPIHVQSGDAGCRAVLMSFGR